MCILPKPKVLLKYPFSEYRIQQHEGEIFSELDYTYFIFLAEDFLPYIKFQCNVETALTVELCLLSKLYVILLAYDTLESVFHFECQNILKN